MVPRHWAFDSIIGHLHIFSGPSHQEISYKFLDSTHIPWVLPGFWTASTHMPIPTPEVSSQSPLLGAFNALNFSHQTAPSKDFAHHHPHNPPIPLDDHDYLVASLHFGPPSGILDSSIKKQFLGGLDSTNIPWVLPGFWILFTHMRPPHTCFGGQLNLHYWPHRVSLIPHESGVVDILVWPHRIAHPGL
jgi:hypothetical protein